METVFFKDRRIGFKISIPETFQEVRKEEYPKLGVSRDTILMGSLDKETSLSIVLGAFTTKEDFIEIIKQNVSLLKERNIELIHEEESKLKNCLAYDLYLSDGNKKVRETLVLINDMLIIFSINMDHQNLIHGIKALKATKENKTLNEILKSLEIFTPINPPLSLAQEQEEEIVEEEEEFFEEKSLAQKLIEQDSLYKGIALPKFYFKYNYFKDNEVVVLTILNNELYFSGFKDEFLIIEKNEELQKEMISLVEKHFEDLHSQDIGDNRPKSNSLLLVKNEDQYLYVDIANAQEEKLKFFFSELKDLFKDKNVDKYEVFPEHLISFEAGETVEETSVEEETEAVQEVFEEEAIEETIEEEVEEDPETPETPETVEEEIKSEVSDEAVEEEQSDLEETEEPVEEAEVPQEVVAPGLLKEETFNEEGSQIELIYHFMADAPIFRFRVPNFLREKVNRDFNVFDLIGDNQSYRVFLFPCESKEIYETKVEDWMSKNIQTAGGLLESKRELLVDGNEIKNYLLANNKFYKVAYLSNYLIAISSDMEDNNYPLADYIMKNLEILDSSPSYTEAFARKLRSIEVLKEEGIPYIDELPVIVSSHNVHNRTVDEIARRAIALCISANYAIDVANISNKRELKNSKKFFTKLLDNFKVKSYLSPNEKKLFDGNDQNLAIQISWQFESLVILFWALHLIEEIPATNELINPKLISSILSEVDNYVKFINKCHLRDIHEILDLADLTYRYDWYCVEASLTEEEHDKLNPEIILERHRALNWLITNENWDEVDTST